MMKSIVVVTDLYRHSYDLDAAKRLFVACGCSNQKLMRRIAEEQPHATGWHTEARESDNA